MQSDEENKSFISKLFYGAKSGVSTALDYAIDFVTSPVNLYFLMLYLATVFYGPYILYILPKNEMSYRRMQTGLALMAIPATRRFLFSVPKIVYNVATQPYLMGSRALTAAASAAVAFSVFKLPTTSDEKANLLARIMGSLGGARSNLIDHVVNIIMMVIDILGWVNVNISDKLMDPIRKIIGTLLTNFFVPTSLMQFYNFVIASVAGVDFSKDMTVVAQSVAANVGRLKESLPPEQKIGFEANAARYAFQYVDDSYTLLGPVKRMVNTDSFQPWLASVFDLWARYKGGEPIGDTATTAITHSGDLLIKGKVIDEKTREKFSAFAVGALQYWVDSGQELGPELKSLFGDIKPTADAALAQKSGEVGTEIVTPQKRSLDDVGATVVVQNDDGVTIETVANDPTEPPSKKSSYWGSWFVSGVEASTPPYRNSSMNIPQDEIPLSTPVTDSPKTNTKAYTVKRPITDDVTLNIYERQNPNQMLRMKKEYPSKFRAVIREGEGKGIYDDEVWYIDLDGKRVPLDPDYMKYNGESKYVPPLPVKKLSTPVTEQKLSEPVTKQKYPESGPYIPITDSVTTSDKGPAFGAYKFRGFNPLLPTLRRETLNAAGDKIVAFNAPATNYEIAKELTKTPDNIRDDVAILYGNISVKDKTVNERFNRLVDEAVKQNEANKKAIYEQLAKNGVDGEIIDDIKTAIKTGTTATRVAEELSRDLVDENNTQAINASKPIITTEDYIRSKYRKIENTFIGAGLPQPGPDANLGATTNSESYFDQLINFLADTRKAASEWFSQTLDGYPSIKEFLNNHGTKLAYILGMVVTAIIAYYLIKWYAKRKLGKQKQTNQNVLENFAKFYESFGLISDYIETQYMLIYQDRVQRYMEDNILKSDRILERFRKMESDEYNNKIIGLFSNLKTKNNTADYVMTYFTTIMDISAETNKKIETITLLGDESTIDRVSDIRGKLIVFYECFAMLKEKLDGKSSTRF